MPPRRKNQELTSPRYVLEVPVVWRQTDEAISHSGRSKFCRQPRRLIPAVGRLRWIQRQEYSGQRSSELLAAIEGRHGPPRPRPLLPACIILFIRLNRNICTSLPRSLAAVVTHYTHAPQGLGAKADLSGSPAQIHVFFKKSKK